MSTHLTQEGIMRHIFTFHSKLIWCIILSMNHTVTAEIKFIKIPPKYYEKLTQIDNQHFSVAGHEEHLQPL